MSQSPTDHFYKQAYSEQVRMLFHAMPASTIANIISAILLLIAQWRAIELPVLLLWFCFAISVTFLRAILYLAYKKKRPGDDEIASWGHWFNIGSSMSGLVLGAAGVFLFPDNDPLHQLMCAFVLVGMASGAISTLSFCRTTYPLYISFALVPLYIRLIFEGTELAFILLPMLMLVFVFMLKSSSRIYSSSEQNIILRLQAVAKEESLLRAQQKQDLHTRSTPMGVIEWDRDFRVTAWNPSAENIFGFTEDEALGHHAKELILTDSVIEHVDDIWKQLLNANGGFRSTNENIRKDGRVIMCEWYNTPLKSSNGDVIAVASLVEDITDRVEAEKNLLRAKEEAEKANMAKSEFLSRMSHELRTPMNAVLGFAQLLALDLKDEKNKDNVEEILKSGHHLLELINEVLDLSKIEAGKFDLDMVDVNLYEMLQLCINMVNTQARQKHIDIQYEFSADDNFLVRADTTRLKQVMLNLLSNAIKYNCENGRVSINCQPQPDNRIRLLITDTGPGLTEEQQQHLFKPFERVGAEKTSIEGTGIGLVISKLLIEKMQGDIGFDTTSGAGSTFWIDLKLAG